MLRRIGFLVRPNPISRERDPIETAAEDTDDFANVVRVPFAQTSMQVCAITNTGTATVNIWRKDGSVAAILSSNRSAATREARQHYGYERENARSWMTIYSAIGQRDT